MKHLLLIFAGTLMGVNCFSQSEITPQKLIKDPAVGQSLYDQNLLENEYKKNIDDASNIKYSNLNKNFIPITTVGLSIAEIVPKISFNEQINLQEIRQIKLIDVRSDISKVGFLPVILDLKKKGIKSVGFQIKDGPLKWLTKNFIDSHIITDSTTKRDLIIVLQKCWFSTYANEPYSASNLRLKTSLEYEFDIYTLFNNLYFPQKRINGTFTEQYN